MRTLQCFSNGIVFLDSVYISMDIHYKFFLPPHSVRKLTPDTGLVGEPAGASWRLKKNNERTQ